MNAPQLELVAEIGSNHNGSLLLARQHVIAAAQAGATQVKFQLFRADTLTKSSLASLRRLEVPLPWIPELSALAHSLRMAFSVSIFDAALAREVAAMQQRHHEPLVDYVKIAAYDLPYTDLIRTCADIGVPLVLSTAMATNDEIAAALEAAKKAPIAAILHGVAQYPADPCSMRIRRISAFLPHRVGLSDHTLTAEVAVLAVALGGTWFEKHFRLATLPSDCTADAPHSLPPKAFRNYCAQLIRAFALCQAEPAHGPLPEELPLYFAARRTNDAPRRP